MRHVTMVTRTRLTSESDRGSGVKGRERSSSISLHQRIRAKSISVQRSTSAQPHRSSPIAISPQLQRSSSISPQLQTRSPSISVQRSPSIASNLSGDSTGFTEAEAKDRWKNIGKAIIMVSNVASQFQKLEVTRKEIEKTQSQIKSYLEHKFDVDPRFMFDPTIFKRPKQEIFFSRELDEVGRNVRLRTSAQIRSLRLTLRDCSSFAAYPEYVQTELCRVGLLERFCRGRVILREGHLPGRVYFILCGTVVLTRFNKDLKEEQTQQILNKGDIFGDTEVLEQTMRTATVTTALDAMFWSVDGQDFKNSMTRNLEHASTCSIQGKALRLTRSKMDSCTITINEDSSEHVTSRATTPRGSLTVARDHEVAISPRGSMADISMARRGSLALRARSASMTAMTARSAIHDFLCSLKWFDDVPTTKFLEDSKAATLVYFRNNKCIVQSSSSSDLLCFVRGGKCDVITRITIETNVRPPSAVSCFSTGMSYHDQKQRRIRPVTGIIRDRDDRISIISRPVSAPCKARANTATSSTYKQGETGSDYTSGKITGRISDQLGYKDTDTCSDLNSIAERTKKSSPGVGGGSREAEKRRRTRPGTGSRSRVQSGKRTAGRRPGTAKLSTKSVSPTKQEFLKVCTLEGGDVYGMTSLFSVDDELETSLVSRGCECVIVKKDTFLLLLNKQTKDNIKEMILFYPSYPEMKKKLMNLYSWSTYKDNLRVKSGRINPG